MRAVEVFSAAIGNHINVEFNLSTLSNGGRKLFRFHPRNESWIEAKKYPIYSRSFKRLVFWVKVIACSGDCFHLTLLHSLPPSNPFSGPRGRSGSSFKCNFKWQPSNSCFLVLIQSRSSCKHFRQHETQKLLTFVSGCLLVCLSDKSNVNRCCKPARRFSK